MVETTGSGTSTCNPDIKVWGPSGTCPVEITRKSVEDGTILGRYKVLTPGKYVICIMLSGKGVPGSPFTVYVFDTDCELSHFLQKQEFSSF